MPTYLDYLQRRLAIVGGGIANEFGETANVAHNTISGDERNETLETSLVPDLH